MSTQKFILRNRETGEVVVSEWLVDVQNGEASSIAIKRDDWKYQNDDTHELIPIGYVPLSAVREMLWHVLEVLKLNGPSSPCRATLMEDLDQLAKQYGGE